SLLLDGDKLAALIPAVAAFATEAAWATADWKSLEEILAVPGVGEVDERTADGFVLSVGKVLLAIKNGRQNLDSKVEARGELMRIRKRVGETLSLENTVSLRSCTDQLWRLQVLEEVD